jgi:hypothetical protein
MSQDEHVKLNAESSWKKIAFSKKKAFFFHQQIGLKFMEEFGKCYILSTAFYSAEIWTLRKIDQKFLERFEMWF